MSVTTSDTPRRHPDSMPTRAIRRGQLRQIVPLADTTIYEMERRGEFPRRFALTRRCVVWDLGEVETWLAEHKRDAEAGVQDRAPLPNVRDRKTRPVVRRLIGSPVERLVYTERFRP